MDLGNVLGFAADATGFGAQFDMAEDLFDAAAPLLQFAGEVAPLVALACPPAGAACAFAGNGAQIAQQLGFGNADEKAKQSAKSEQPVQTMAKSEEVQPRSAERRETSGRERSETVSERHRERPVSDHRTERGADDRRPVRDHRTDGDERDARRTTTRSRPDSRFAFESGDSLVVRIAKALAGNVQLKVDELEELTGDVAAGNGEDPSGDALVIQGKAQQLAAMVSLASNTVQNIGQADQTAVGQTA